MAHEMNEKAITILRKPTEWWIKGVALGVALIAFGAITAVALPIIAAIGGKLLFAGFVVAGLSLAMKAKFFLFNEPRYAKIKKKLEAALELSHIHSIERNHKIDKPIALVIQAEEDSKGTIYRDFPRKLEPKYQIVTAIAKECSDVTKAIQAIGPEKIKLIWIHAHGKATSCLLSLKENENRCLAAQNLDYELLQKVSVDTPIVFASCRTGTFQDKDGNLGLARAVSQKIPHRIYAPTDTASYKLKNCGNSLKVQFFNGLFFFKKDVTICYQNGMQVGNPPYF